MKVDEEAGHNEILYADKKDAARVFHSQLSVEANEGCIERWKGRSHFQSDQGDLFYECWLDGDYLSNHYEIRVEEKQIILPHNWEAFCRGVGITLMQKYNGVAPHIHNTSKKDCSHPILELRVDGNNCSDTCRSCDINRFLRAARARYWRELFDLPELREKMTSSMRDEYHGTIEKMKDYEFSEFNIRQVIDQIMGQLVVGVEAAILNCFDKLSAEHTYHTDVQNDNIHYYNGWKTNKAHYVNMKCIIPTYGCFARGYKTDRYGRWKDTLEGLDVRGCFSTLDDLEKALDYIDCGETAPTNLEQTLQLAARDGKTSVSCKYFDVVFYKKGSATDAIPTTTPMTPP